MTLQSVSSPTFTDRTTTELLVVHCSATRPSLDIGAREISQWHVQRGFDTIGYHYVIRRNGELESGRRESAIGAHVRGHNGNSIGICLVGGVDTDNKPQNNFSEAQFNTLQRLLSELQSRYPQTRVLGHRDLSPDLNGDGRITPNEFIKACPSLDIAQWFKERKSGL